MNGEIVYKSQYSELKIIERNGTKCICKKMRKRLSNEEIDIISKFSFSDSGVETVFDIYAIDDDDYKTEMIIEYIRGESIYGILSKEKLNQMIMMIKGVKKEFDKLTFNSSFLISVFGRTDEYIGLAEDVHIKNLGFVIKRIYEQYASVDDLNSVCLYDLHRGNLLYGLEEKWRIVDVDAIVLGTDTFMFSCLVAVGILLEGYSADEVFNIIKKSESENVNRILVEVLIRLYWGFVFFDWSNKNDELYKRYAWSIRSIVKYIKLDKLEDEEQLRHFVRNCCDEF